jgi:hypothetical protein
MHCFFDLSGRTDSISDIFLMGSFIVVATEIHVTLNHFEIVIKFNPTLRSQLVSYTVAVWWCRSQWPRSLRHELYSPVQTLGSLVRIPLEAWMFVCVYSF